MEKRVVITGLGAVTPVGIGKENFYNALLAGQSGIGPITRFDASDYATRIAGEVKDFDITNYGVDKKEARRMDRSVEFAIGAAVLACEDADLDLDKQDLDRCGTVAPPTVCDNCLKHCSHKFCIIRALSRAQQGDVETGLVFSGNNMRKVDRIMPVKDIFAQLKQQVAEID